MEQLLRCMEMLNTDDRAAVLRYMADLDKKETATLLGRLTRLDSVQGSMELRRKARLDPAQESMTPRSGEKLLNPVLELQELFVLRSMEELNTDDRVAVERSMKELNTDDRITVERSMMRLDPDDRSAVWSSMGEARLLSTAFLILLLYSIQHILFFPAELNTEGRAAVLRSMVELNKGDRVAVLRTMGEAGFLSTAPSNGGEDQVCRMSEAEKHRKLIESPRKESRLRTKASELTTLLEKLNRNCELKLQQSPEFKADLKRIDARHQVDDGVHWKTKPSSEFVSIEPFKRIELISDSPDNFVQDQLNDTDPLELLDELIDLIGNEGSLTEEQIVELIGFLEDLFQRFLDSLLVYDEATNRSHKFLFNFTRAMDEILASFNGWLNMTQVKDFPNPECPCT
ncbi:unnamed protein product [Darwinula stevensoni]|uniref:Uncharacterized protein n=1 Tax=Darwinula stevensoni TaxID=69355 RepID=A0A7R9ABA1_9CRUS|nr:unnamed protein product [Darwinula stevensoni]CAG0898947.1 unnamed protein product [Darwinula stevensoni]